MVTCLLEWENCLTEGLYRGLGVVREGDSWRRWQLLLYRASCSIANRKFLKDATLDIRVRD